MDRPLVLINEIILGKRSITPETAKGLGAAFGVSPEWMMRLEAKWQLWKVGAGDPDPVAHRARVYDRVPIREMIRRGWAGASWNPATLEHQVLRFLGTTSLDKHFILPYAAAKGNSYAEQLTPLQEA